MNYDALIAAISNAHQQAKAGVLGAVNRHLILGNWLIGAYLIEFEQNGEDREGDFRTSGAEISFEPPTPLSLDGLFHFSWSHLTELIRLDDPWKRAFYENECLFNRYLVALPKPEQLQQLIETGRAVWEERHPEYETKD